MSSKNTIKQKMLLVSLSTLMSRLLGIIREFLIGRYLGASAVSDVFFTAYKIPNTFRKIFAEGALSAAFVPSIVQTVRTKGRDGVGNIMSLAFLIFEGTLLLLSAFIMYYAADFIRLIASGFSEEQVIMATPWLRILMPFIFFISSSALLAGALQAVNHFFVPAFSPTLLNIVFILGALTCTYFNLPTTYLCWFILTGGLLQLLWHIAAYLKLEFGFSAIRWQNLQEFKPILIKFILCLPATGIEEISLFIDTNFASHLPSGSISLLNYAARFRGIPLGIFGVAISTILLPHFSKISTYAPKRLSFYLLESTKLIIWLMLPVALLMGFFAQDIFVTIFVSKKFSVAQAYQAAFILRISLIGLIALSLNKIMRNIFYSLHNTWTPAIISIAAITVNYIANNYLISIWQAPGLTLASSISSLVQCILFVLLLKYQFDIKIYGESIALFLGRYLAQLSLLTIPFLAAYYGICALITHYFASWTHILLETIVLWLWVGPLCGLLALAIYSSRRSFNIKLYFLD
jgi:putative peptidoglycan lipid II flippase